jgi:hypothetical protein
MVSADFVGDNRNRNVITHLKLSFEGGSLYDT